ncbi:hypothetical protein BRADI_5g24750v3 [Brachypodium distachyon]|uniref:Protein kinase domain-containing protein n=1 Tax=Brachypodium distachyon TaxID=15368 RepID=A0A2K2CJ48_BRADI|nr:hypothetical protein BRADI_5g24750v3 [Brachypodium distachyon]
MALDGGILALAITGIITTGILTVVVVVAIYLCAKVAVQMRSQKEISKSGHRDTSIGNGNTPRPSAAEEYADADMVEMGSMSFFLEVVQNERPARFSSQQLRVFTQGFAHRVGSGGFGVVYKGRFPNGAPVAVKVLNSTLGRRAEEQFMAEVGTIGRTYHINLVRLYGFCFDASVKALVYEYMDHGSLDRHLFVRASAPEKRGVGIGFNKLHEIAVGTAKAVRYLHEECAQRIIHYDIKPMPVTHKCDVYSYGMLLFEMLGRRRNLELLGVNGREESQEWCPRWVWHRFEAGETDTVLARAMVAGDVEDMEKAARICKVALWCVQYRPEDRPSMGNVVRMLEGEEEIATPGNPFAHLTATAPARRCHRPRTTPRNRTSLRVSTAGRPPAGRRWLYSLIGSWLRMSIYQNSVSVSRLFCCSYQNPILTVKILHI